VVFGKIAVFDSKTTIFPWRLAKTPLVLEKHQFLFNISHPAPTMGHSWAGTLSQSDHRLLQVQYQKLSLLL